MKRREGRKANAEVGDLEVKVRRKPLEEARSGKSWYGTKGSAAFDFVAASPAWKLPCILELQTHPAKVCKLFDMAREISKRLFWETT